MGAEIDCLEIVIESKTSLKHNFSGMYGGKRYENFNANKLFDAIGIEPDWEKIKYYLLLDELF